MLDAMYNSIKGPPNPERCFQYVIVVLKTIKYNPEKCNALIINLGKDTLIM